MKTPSLAPPVSDVRPHSRLAVASFVSACLLCLVVVAGTLLVWLNRGGGERLVLIFGLVTFVICLPIPVVFAVSALVTSPKNLLFAKLALGVLAGLLIAVAGGVLWLWLRLLW